MTMYSFIEYFDLANRSILIYGCLLKSFNRWKIVDNARDIDDIWEMKKKKKKRLAGMIRINI